MAAKSAEQYVEYALKHFSEHHKTAVRVIQELRAAGWLREANEAPHVVALEGYKRTVEQLTRERDEARAESWCYKTLAQKNYDNAASPEVMRVLERAEACHRRWRFRPPGSPEALALFAAVDALSASRQPKAQEPRWTTEVLPHIFGPRGETLYGVNKGGDWFGPLSPSMCHELAKRLNGEGGAK